MVNHIAVIPARKNSKGLKFKNRKLLDRTLNFLKKVKWINKTIITTDDKKIIKIGKKNKLQVLERSKKNSLDKASIKSVMVEVIKKKNLNSDDVIWLLYIPIIGRKEKHYKIGKKLIEKKGVSSICSFTPVKTHPYNAWIYKKQKIIRLIKNDVYRRQDLPKMWSHHHLICAFKVGIIKQLNSELIYSHTIPIFFDQEKEKIFEIDSPLDLKYLYGKKIKK